MPTFIAEIKQEVEVKGEVEFEVFCSCGEGICNQSEGRQSRHRGMPQVVVEPCPKCMEAAKEAGREDGYDQGSNEMSDKLQPQIDELQAQVDALTKELEAARATSS